MRTLTRADIHTHSLGDFFYSHMMFSTFCSISELAALIPQSPLRMRVATDKKVKSHMTVMFQAAYNREHCLEFNMFCLRLAIYFSYIARSRWQVPIVRLAAK